MTSHHHYLSIEHWSPRYDEKFFTAKMTGKEKLTSQPQPIPEALQGNYMKNHPAIYYRIEVYSQQKKHVCLRRYSHFEWLHQRLLLLPSEDSSSRKNDLSLPPKTCPWQIHNEEFLQNRLEELREYILDALSRPDFARDDAMREFLELNSF